MKVKSIQSITYFILFLILVGVFFFCPDSLGSKYTSSYYTLCTNLFFIFLIWLVFSRNIEIDIFDPFLFTTIIHLMLFEITPLICLWSNNLYSFNIDSWGGCIKGTWISTIGYISVALFYFYRINLRKNRFIADNANNEEKTEIDITNTNKIFYVNLGIWIFSFLCAIILVVSSGKNLQYMLTLSSSALDNTEGISSSGLQFLGVFSYMMLPSFLYILDTGKSRVLKIILFYLMSMSFLIRGFRFILVAIIVGPIVMFYLKKDKRPRAFQIALVLVILVLMIGFVGFIRSSVRAGAGIESVNSFGLDTVLDAVVGNFEIFKTYYGIIEHIPSDMGFTLGQQMLWYTLIMLIPRAIWPSKPQPVLRQAITVSVSSYANIAGTAYPYIGEYYQEFGVIGVLVFSAILGCLLKKLRSHMRGNDIHSVVLFSTLYPLLLQVLIRGYTPSNFYMTLFVLIPVVLTKHISIDPRKI